MKDARLVAVTVALRTVHCADGKVAWKDVRSVAWKDVRSVAK